MMSPLVALDDHGQLAAIAGAAGGSRIRPALVQCVLRMLRGEDPQHAIDQPRLNALPGSGPAGAGLHSARWSPRWRRTGRVAVADHLDHYFGGVSALSPLGGGADPRRSGYVIMA